MIDMEQFLTEPGILSIRIWDDPVLSQICAKVEDNEFGPQLESFGQQLLWTMDRYNGLGLAAPQVGVRKRMFVMHFPDWQNDSDYLNGAKAPIVVCNPTLMLEGSTIIGREGCLSLPNVFEEVARAETLRMQFRYPNGEPGEVQLDNMNARVGQHEFDHLEGRMYFDRLLPRVREELLQRWEKEKQKDV